MSFMVNIGYKFSLDPAIQPSGSILLASAIPMHTLTRRNLSARHPHLATRLFDPQLYLSGLDPAACQKPCAVLASYPWFGLSAIEEYDSGLQTQAAWRRDAEARIHQHWRTVPASDPAAIALAVQQCIDFQLAIGVASLILPSPLTSDPATDYSLELAWLDASLSYLQTIQPHPVPAFATVAISDICLRYTDPEQNALLDLILDAVSSRGPDGVYLVLEQASEPSETRHCGSIRPLASMLHMVHIFSGDARLRVGVNFVGFFGLACEAAGAEFWASGWYKSLYRCRLADRMTTGRAYPSYWSYPSALDIHLEGDFDALAAAGMSPSIADQTVASQGLLRAAQQGRPSASVAAWAYSQSNVAAAQDHFLMSAVQAERTLPQSPTSARVAHVDDWLTSAAARAARIAAILGPSSRTRAAHVQAWADAYAACRRVHGF